MNTIVNFSDYENSLPVISLPLYFYCDKPVKKTFTGMPGDIILKYSGNLTSQVMGKINNTGDYITILYLVQGDIQVPFICTFDRQGKKISTLQLFDKYCGENEASIGMSWAEITHEVTIIKDDSETTFNRDAKGEIIKETMKTAKHEQDYTINEKGYIVKKQNS